LPLEYHSDSPSLTPKITIRLSICTTIRLARISTFKYYYLCDYEFKIGMTVNVMRQ